MHIVSGVVGFGDVFHIVLVFSLRFGVMSSYLCMGHLYRVLY